MDIYEFATKEVAPGVFQTGRGDVGAPYVSLMDCTGERLKRTIFTFADKVQTRLSPTGVDAVIPVRRVRSKAPDMTSEQAQQDLQDAIDAFLATRLMAA